MRKLSVFDSISLDGYFTNAANDMSWAHAPPDDAEWNAFVQGNASGGATGEMNALVFGRVTYEMMIQFWPTPMALQSMPEVATHMNAAPKIVFSNTLREATWQNTMLVSGDVAKEMQRIKSEAGPNMTILGSGKLVAALTQAGLIDSYQLVILPVVLGSGRSLFEGVSGNPRFRQTASRTFKNGNIVLGYDRVR